jgi:hypothetical protein
MGHSHQNCPALARLSFRLTLLVMAAEANSADEMINSPEIKPTRPIINIVAVKISFCNSFMRKFSHRVEGVFKLQLNYSGDVYC